MGPRPRAARDRWQIEHELRWWYLLALKDRARAAVHARAAIDAWERLVATGGTQGQEAQPGTFVKLRDCALEAGDPDAAARYGATQQRLEASRAR